jgi:hypothetical protein
VGVELMRNELPHIVVWVTDDWSLEPGFMDEVPGLEAKDQVLRISSSKAPTAVRAKLYADPRETKVCLNGRFIGHYQVALEKHEVQGIKRGDL